MNPMTGQWCSSSGVGWKNLIGSGSAKKLLLLIRVASIEEDKNSQWKITRANSNPVYKLFGLCAGKQGTSAEVRALTLMFEKSAAEPKPKLSSKQHLTLWL